MSTITIVIISIAIGAVIGFLIAALFRPKDKDYKEDEEEDEENEEDKYHTMDELYEHRHRLFIALLHTLDREHPLTHTPWKAKKHSDGSMFADYFIAGIDLEAGKMITYHLPIAYWEDIDIEQEYETAPTFDGHSTQDVLERLKRL